MVPISKSTPVPTIRSVNWRWFATKLIKAVCCVTCISFNHCLSSDSTLLPGLLNASPQKHWWTKHGFQALFVRALSWMEHEGHHICLSTPHQHHHPPANPTPTQSSCTKPWNLQPPLEGLFSRASPAPAACCKHTRVRVRVTGWTDTRARQRVSSPPRHLDDCHGRYGRWSLTCPMGYRRGSHSCMSGECKADAGVCGWHTHKNKKKIDRELLRCVCYLWNFKHHIDWAQSSTFSLESLVCDHMDWPRRSQGSKSRNRNPSSGSDLKRKQDEWIIPFYWSTSFQLTVFVAHDGE